MPCPDNPVCQGCRTPEACDELYALLLEEEDDTGVEMFSGQVAEREDRTRRIAELRRELYPPADPHFDALAQAALNAGFKPEEIDICEEVPPDYPCYTLSLTRDGAARWASKQAFEHVDFDLPAVVAQALVEKLSE